MAEGWKRLEGDLCNWLKSLAGPGLEYRNPHQAIPGFPHDGFRSDGCITDGQTLLAIEVEAAQMHPDTNVGKYWLLHEKRPYERIVLFHIYTPDYDSYPWRMELGKFYVDRMGDCVPLEYVFIDRRKASDYDETLREMRDIILRRASLLFPGQIGASG